MFLETTIKVSLYSLFFLTFFIHIVVALKIPIQSIFFFFFLFFFFFVCDQPPFPPVKEWWWWWWYLCFFVVVVVVVVKTTLMMTLDDVGKKESIEMNKAEEKKHGIRRKRTLTDDEPGKRGDDDDDDDEPDNKDERHHRAEHDQNAFVEHAFAAVVEYVGHFFAKLSKFLSSAFTGRDDDDGKHDAILTNASLETAVNIRTRLDVAYDEMQTEHVEMLETLWRSCFEEDGVTFPSSSTAASSSSSSSSPRRQPRLGSASEKWKEMGWQGTHPSTDLRGCGVFALENLVYFAQTRKDSFKVLVEKKNGTRSDWEYPFAAAGVNVTHELTKLLDVDGIIRNGTVGETLRVDKCVVGFFELIRRHSGSIASGSRFDENGVGIVSVFHEIYCDAFEILDQEWLLAKATYMEFAKVLERTIQTRVKENLERLADEARSVS